MDGKPLEEGKGIDFTVEVGSGRFIPAFEEKLIGLKPEEEKEIEVSFPEDYGYQKWAGKTITFHVKVKEIKEKILPPLDDEFAKDLGDYASLEELKTKLREDLQKERENGTGPPAQRSDGGSIAASEIPSRFLRVWWRSRPSALISDTKMRLASQGMDFERSGSLRGETPGGLWRDGREAGEDLSDPRKDCGAGRDYGHG